MKSIFALPDGRLRRSQLIVDARRVVGERQRVAEIGDRSRLALGPLPRDLVPAEIARGHLDAETGAPGNRRLPAIDLELGGSVACASEAGVVDRADVTVVAGHPVVREADAVAGAAGVAGRAEVAVVAKGAVVGGAHRRLAAAHPTLLHAAKVVTPVTPKVVAVVAELARVERAATTTDVEHADAVAAAGRHVGMRSLRADGDGQRRLETGRVDFAVDQRERAARGVATIEADRVVADAGGPEQHVAPSGRDRVTPARAATCWRMCWRKRRGATTSASFLVAR